ncbi:MAG: GlxA family transcriptional regulator [Sphingomonadales bacterium]
MMSYAAVAEPFRAANVLSERHLYEWRHIARARGAATASNGAELRADADVGDALDVDFLFVFAAGNPSRFDDPATLAWLRWLAAKGVRIGGISGGPYVLAHAGLLDGYRCTIHWEHRPAFAEAFPMLRVQQSLYVVDRERLTCAGGTAGLDLAIDLIAAEHGRPLADRVGEWYIRTQLRDAGADQRMSLRDRFGTANEKVLAALRLLETSPEDPPGRAELAQQVGVSIRQLERLFACELGSSIATQARSLRLDRAMTMLRETGLSVTEIAVASGFVSPSHFSRSFRHRFGLAPTAARRRHGPRFAP